MRKNYLIMLGAPKCGTSSLSAWLGLQPYAALARQKETLYFTDFADLDWSGPGADFLEGRPQSVGAFFDEYSENPEAELRIEASTDNLSCPAAVENIARFVDRDDVGEFWLVAVLRDPIERIVSEYEHTLRLGWQTDSLLDSLKLEKERKDKGYHPLFRHIERSHYFTQIGRYKEIFGDRLTVLDFHRIREDAERKKLLGWMGYADEVEGELQHDNKRHVVKRPQAVQFLKNERLLDLGRRVFPKRMRPALRNLLTGREVGRYQARESEIDFILAAMRDEIAACVEAHEIPTDNWTVPMRCS